MAKPAYVFKSISTLPDRKVSRKVKIANVVNMLRNRYSLYAWIKRKLANPIFYSHDPKKLLEQAMALESKGSVELAAILKLISIQIKRQDAFEAMVLRVLSSKKDSGEKA